MVENNNDKLHIRFVKDWMYCPYSIYLMFCRGIEGQEKVNPNQELEKITGVNNSVAVKKENVSGQLKGNDIWKWKKSESTDDTVEVPIMVSRNIRIEDDLLVGSIDEVQEYKDKALVIMDIPSHKIINAYNDEVLQVQCCALVYKDSKVRDYVMSGREWNKFIVCVLRCKDDGKVKWAKEFTEEDENEVNSCIDDICMIITDKCQVKPTNNIHKHEGCRLSKVCDWSKY